MDFVQLKMMSFIDIFHEHIYEAYNNKFQMNLKTSGGKCPEILFTIILYNNLAHFK